MFWFPPTQKLKGNVGKRWCSPWMIISIQRSTDIYWTALDLQVLFSQTLMNSLVSGECKGMKMLTLLAINQDYNVTITYMSVSKAQ